MKLEEAHKYIVDDNRGILEKPDYFVIEEKYEAIYATLFFDITDLVSGDESVIENIKNNPLVKNFKNKGDCYYVDTTFGEGTFFKAIDVLGEEATNLFVQPNGCHDNSIIAALMINNVYPNNNPVVLTGVTTFSSGKPVLHSVYAVDTRMGRVVVDYTYNVAMSEDLFKKLYNFKVLAETHADNLVKYADLDKEYRKYMEKHGIDRGCNCSGVYFLLSNEDSLQYMKDVIEERREDDFPFLTDKDFERKMEKLKKQASEIKESKKR